MASVLFATMGSWGDLFPFIGVGVELQRRGHHVRIGSSPAWERMVTEAGLGFVPLGRWIGFEDFEEHPEVLRPIPFGLRAALRHFLFDQADGLSESIAAALRGADVLVAHPAHLIAQNVAEAQGVPCVVATVFPGMIPSGYTVPAGSTIGPWRGRIGRAINRRAWSTAAVVTSLLFDGPINHHRRGLGLDPVRAGPLRLPLRAERIVVMASPTVIAPPPDWPGSVRTTSFVLWDRSAQIPVAAEIDAFVSGGEPPVLITLGGSGGIGAGDFLTVAADAVVSAGARALIVAGAGPMPRTSHDPNAVHVTDYVPYRAIAGSCRMAVHHAGIGTTVAFMRAGVPHVAVPRAFDQPVTAGIIERLGVGATLPWRRRKSLGAAVASVLGSEEHAAAARRLAHRLRDDVDGAVPTADVVEEVIAERTDG